MELERESHLFGETILEHHFPDEHRELVDVLGRMDVPLREPGPFQVGRGKPPKRQLRTIRGKRRYMLLPADLPMMNRQLDRALRELGWRQQPFATDEVFASTGDRSRGDFERNGVFVEVEFGNTASLYRDVFKFQVASRERRGEVAVLIAASNQLARFHDSGVATYEKVTRMLPYFTLVLQMPLWIIGLVPSDMERLRERYAAMYEEAAGHGLECHAWDDVYTAHPEEVIDQPDEG
jgi:hypothetical protein